MMKSQAMLVTVSGADRTGIVRDVAAALLHLEVNVEDSSMTALRGEFTMMMIIRLPEAVAMAALKAALADLEQKTGLVTQSQPLPANRVEIATPEPNCVVTVTGGDKPGIVHGVAEILAQCGASIVDLSTTTRETHYLMALEVAADSVEGLQQRLEQTASRLQVEIVVIPMEETLLHG
ncbi:MAG: ACT domain-containing protein [Mariprofundales bacterium]